MILISELSLLRSDWKYLVGLKTLDQVCSVSIILYGINQNHHQENGKMENGKEENRSHQENQSNQETVKDDAVKDEKEEKNVREDGKEETVKEETVNEETVKDENSKKELSKKESSKLETQEQIEWLAIQEECPHLGQSLIHAEIQIEDDNLIAICPWHSYDFDLRTGESSTGLKACVIKTFVKELDGIQYLFFDRIEFDSFNQNTNQNTNQKTNQEKEKKGNEEEEEEEWKLFSITPISQKIKSTITSEQELPSSLLSWASLILQTPNPIQKIQYTRHSIDLFKSHQIPLTNQTDSNSKTLKSELPPLQPVRETSLDTLRFDDFKFTKKGKSGNEKNRIKLLHSLANIELWAIDLTWDLLCRFGNYGLDQLNKHHKLPREFFLDFCKVAGDEAKHFTILREAIQRLGSDWGELPVHNGLWQSARDTSHSLISRICIIHLVHEARGLDVNPTQIKRVKAAGDFETAKVLEIIHADEITHVAAGHKWLNYLCNQSDPKLDPVEVFRREVKLHFMGKLKPPFNVEDRLKAGLDPSFYENLD
ncbi:uncharacterized protein MELLADRAFT_46386 [Melampsora larici-populina 98AG31]|uniref:Rieske domain-containing protein n=1 Tax=Melampsora larici-populina (strain 98AG31 / pathotype 3-4-7) TaxID=747676 RepID=F4R3X5_MELLP|nr:uncharacterized protein MELLADRAFT_46386 [Melampsora larici-populina 98AG31]EGG12697.1 hypothetical protein MELLADRAFT_46386 [Melampsora larici-populina 98AG31]